MLLRNAPIRMNYPLAIETDRREGNVDHPRSSIVYRPHTSLSYIQIYHEYIGEKQATFLS